MNGEAQFQALYERHEPDVLAYFLRRLNRDDAVEATAEPPAAKPRARPGKRKRSKRHDRTDDTERAPRSAEPQSGGARDLIEQAAQAKRSGNKAEAARLLERALALEPRNVTALSRLSDVAFDRGQYQDAADYAKKAVGISPRNAGLHLKLGDAYFKLRNYSSAREHYEKALALGNRAAERRLERVDEKGG